MFEHQNTSTDRLQDAPSDSGLGTASLSVLESDEHLSLLDEIDNLRSHGVNQLISVPTLVVCGDRSAGKSSALEAITEIPFPRSGNGMCTRFVTQIMLRRRRQKTATVKILPHKERSDDERIRLAAFNRTVENFSELPNLITEAGREMGLVEGRAFASDILSVEVSGPDKPQITIIDTPGLIRSSDRTQSLEDVHRVSDLVQEYIQDERTIILAIVSARNDVISQAILQKARSVDPSGARTLGIITKPDSADIGRLGAFMNLARNENVSLQLGWHILRSRTPEELAVNTPLEERNKAEQEFFQMAAPWRSLPSSCKGIEMLRKKLSEVLFNHMRQEMPHIYREIAKELKDCTEFLYKLEEDRSTVYKQRQALMRVAENFSHRFREAVNGNYDTPSFYNQAPSTRLRANIEELNEEFAEVMRAVGHLHDILERGALFSMVPRLAVTSDSSIFAQASSPPLITYSQAVDWAMPYLKRARGRELPGTLPPLLINELFAEHSKPWNHLASAHIKAVLRDCNNFVDQALTDLAPPDVSGRLLTSYFEDIFEEIEKGANAELRKLLEDRCGYTITYYRHYAVSAQASRLERLASRAWTAIKDELDELDERRLVGLMKSLRHEDTDKFLCEEALDCMLAYYKVALKTFIDNVAVIVVERRLIRGLLGAFTPSTVHGMSDDDVNRIAAESPDIHEKRKTLKARKTSLERGLKVCSRVFINTRGATSGNWLMSFSEEPDYFGGGASSTKARSTPAQPTQAMANPSISSGSGGRSPPTPHGAPTSNPPESPSSQSSSFPNSQLVTHGFAPYEDEVSGPERSDVYNITIHGRYRGFSQEELRLNDYACGFTQARP